MLSWHLKYVMFFLEEWMDLERKLADLELGGDEINFRQEFNLRMLHYSVIEMFKKC